MGGGLSQQCRLAWGVRVGQNEVVADAVGKNKGGSGGHCSKGIVWQSLTLRNPMVAVDGGVDGGCG